MCKIIEFPVNRIRKTESNGYKNLKALFEVSASVETCSFYLETVEELFRKAQITENEMLTLRRIGRMKRLELANPKQEPQNAEKPGTYLYTPEMGQLCRRYRSASESGDRANYKDCPPRFRKIRFLPELAGNPHYFYNAYKIRFYR